MPSGVYKRKTLSERLFSKLSPPTANGCLEFTGSRHKFGHGQIASGAKRGEGTRILVASRAAWELANGPIPAGLIVCHKCDNPPCCNPDHLFLGTKKDNTQDMLAKGRHKHGVEHYRTKLTLDDIHEIKSLAGVLPQTKIGSKFGLSQAAVSNIISGRSWVGGGSRSPRP